MNNRFELLNLSDDEEETVELTDTVVTSITGYEADSENIGPDFMTNHLVDGKFVDRPMIRSEIYSNYSIDIDEGTKNSECDLYVTDDADKKIQKFDLSLIIEFQTDVNLTPRLDVTRVVPCAGFCCTSNSFFYKLTTEGLYPSIISRALIRIQDLMERNSVLIPICDIGIFYAKDFHKLLSSYDGKSEKFLTHDIIMAIPDSNITLRTWLSFNTGLKTINRKTGRDENLKLFMTTYDRFYFDDFSSTTDEIEEMQNHLSNLKRDLYALQRSGQKFPLNIRKELIARTKNNIRTLQLNNIIEISKRIKFFNDFDDAREFVKAHYGNIKKTLKK